jgi:hypothetical protein
VEAVCELLIEKDLLERETSWKIKKKLVLLFIGGNEENHKILS